MPEFDDVLLRLKERLGVPSDKGVAELLGMGEKALNARKRRGSFPVDKLKSLAADRPELRLDVKYVLTGVSDELERRLAAISISNKIAAPIADVQIRRAVQAGTFRVLVESLSDDEQRLVHCYRGADDQGKTVLLSTATLLAKTQSTKSKKGG